MTSSGAALTGKVAADFTFWYRRTGLIVPISLSDLSAINDPHSDGGLCEEGEGWYRLDLPDAAIAAGVNNVSIGSTVDGGVVLTSPITLTAIPASGTGARTVTITVDDDADPLQKLQNARVRLTEGVNTYTGLTNASGVIVFNVDDASYAVAITKSGYTYAGTTLVVNGDEAETYSMTVVVISPATDPAHSTLSITCYDEELELEAGAVLRLTMSRIPTDDVGRSFDSKTRVLVADSNGLIQVRVARLAEYTIERGDSYQYKVRVEIPDASTCEVESVLGKEVI
jgi:Rieske Fe-S protein